MHGLPARNVGDSWVCVGCSYPNIRKKWQFNSPGRRGCLCATSEYGLFIYLAKILFAFWFLSNWWYIRLDRSMNEWIKDIINLWSLLILRFYQRERNVFSLPLGYNWNGVWKNHTTLTFVGGRALGKYNGMWYRATTDSLRMQHQFSHALVSQCVCARGKNIVWHSPARRLATTRSMSQEIQTRVWHCVAFASQMYRRTITPTIENKSLYAAR